VVSRQSSVVSDQFSVSSPQSPLKLFVPAENPPIPSTFVIPAKASQARSGGTCISAPPNITPRLKGTGFSPYINATKGRKGLQPLRQILFAPATRHSERSEESRRCPGPQTPPQVSPTMPPSLPGCPPHPDHQPWQPTTDNRQRPTASPRV